MKYYPAFLALEKKKAVVIGGGKVAERKIYSLLNAGACVTVVSPTLTARLKKAKDQGRFLHIPREYSKKHLKGAFLVIAATDCASTNSKIAADAPSLVNVVDVPHLCNFIAPSVINRGPLTIAISTGGASPAISKALRKELEKLYGPDFSGYLGFLRKIRSKALAEIADRKQREAFLKGLAAASILNALRSNGLAHVKKHITERLRKLAHQ